MAGHRRTTENTRESSAKMCIRDSKQRAVPVGLVTGQAGFAAGETEVKADARRGVPFRLRN